MKNIYEQISEANRSFQRLKRHSPYLFNEWQALQIAKSEFQKAKAVLAEARKIWKNL